MAGPWNGGPRAARAEKEIRFREVPGPDFLFYEHIKTQKNKDMKKFLVTPLLFVLAAAAFVGCDDNEYIYYELPDEARVIDFEGANLGTDGFIWGKGQATEQDDTDWQGQPIRSDIYYGPIYTEKEAQIYEEFYKLKYCSTVVYMVPRA